MSITTITARDAELPVSLVEAKAHLRVMDGALDEHIQSLLEAAVGYCESTTGRSLRAFSTLTQKFCEWPCGPVMFDRNPVLAEVDSEPATIVTYFDANGDAQTVDDANYRVHAGEAAGYLEFDANFALPTHEYRDDAITIQYAAGYGSVQNVPKQAKPAVMLTLELLFGNLDERYYANCEKSRDALLNQMQPGYYR